MKASQIRSHMERGTLYVIYKDTICEVLHLFKDETWINFSGNLFTVKHSELNYHRLQKGDSTYKKVRLGNKHIINKLYNEYKEKLNLNKSGEGGLKLRPNELENTE